MQTIGRFPWLIPTIIFTILVISGANMHPLWGDEAETALFARNILKYGVPKGWDGVNIMGIENAIVLNKDLINHSSPWAQYYITAASFKIFGESTFTARLPSILLAIASLPILYFLVLKLSKSRLTAFLTLLILSLSPAFILFAYQARYYSINIFAAMVLALSLFSLHDKKILPKVTFLLAGILFIYANYVVFTAFYSSLWASYMAYLILEKRLNKLWKTLTWWGVILTAMIVLSFMPWYFTQLPFAGRGGHIVAPELNFPYILDFLKLYQVSLYPYNLSNGLPILFIPFFFITVCARYFKKLPVSALVWMGFLIGIYLLVMTFFTAVVEGGTIFLHTRYTITIFPFMGIFCAMLIGYAWKWKKIVAVFVLIILITTNLFTLNPFRSFLFEFIGEIVNPYPTPDKVVADYLKQHVKKGDTAFVTLDRDHYPLIFHLGNKIRFVNRVTLVNNRIFPANRQIIPRYIYDFRDDPDWIILYSKRGNDGTFLTFDFRSIPESINFKNYQEIVLPVFFADMSRPEIEWRSFRKIDPAPDDQVFIYKKHGN